MAVPSVHSGLKSLFLSTPKWEICLRFKTLNQFCVQQNYKSSLLCCLFIDSKKVVQKWGKKKQTMKEWTMSCLPEQFCHIFQKVNSSWHCLYCSATQAVSGSPEMPATDKKVKRSNASSQEKPALDKWVNSLFAWCATELPVCAHWNAQGLDWVLGCL